MENVIRSTNQKNKLFCLLFTLLWGGLVLVNLITPPQHFSQAENRTLAAFPSYTTQRLLDGDYMEDMNTYLNDQFVARPTWVSGQSLIEFGLGKREVSGVYIGKNALYRHYPAEKPDISSANVQGIAAFAQKYGIPVSLMLVPSSTYINRQNLPFSAPYWDEAAYIEDVYQQLNGTATTINVTDTLEAHRSEYIYYRTDHHWTSYGAWLGYQQLAAALGLPNRESELAINRLTDDFLGTNHSRTGYPLVTPDAMESYQIGSAASYETYGLVNSEYATTEYASIYFPDYLSQKDKYSYFFGTLEPYVTIHTASTTGKKLIIFKDSYAHCLAPMLMADYSEIRLVDLRSFVAEDYGAFVQAQNYDEALFLYSTDTFAQQLGPGRLL